MFLTFKKKEKPKRLNSGRTREDLRLGLGCKEQAEESDKRIRGSDGEKSV